MIELLRELWDCELKSFETVGKLTEIFVLRAETLTELGKLAEQVRSNSLLIIHLSVNLFIYLL